MNRLGYYLREGTNSIFKHRLNSFATVFIILACLLVMGTFSLVTVNVNYIFGNLEDEVQVLAFVDERLSEEDARNLESAILEIPNVASTQFITRQEAMESYLSQLKYSKLFEDVEADTFRDRYTVTMTDLSIMADTQLALAGIPGIAEVYAHPGVANGMIKVRQIVNIVCIIMVLLLMIVSVFIMSNTLRMAAFSRRNELSLVRMIGATKSFINMPFMIEGMFLGLTGSVAAFILEWLIYNTMATRIAQSALAFLQILPFSVMLWPLLFSFLGIGLIVAVFGSTIAIRDYTRI